MARSAGARQISAAGYAAPILVDVGEGEHREQQIVAFLRSEVAGFAAADGRLRWSHPHPTEYGVNASMPLWNGDGLIFVSSAYDQGSLGLELRVEDGAVRPVERWRQRKLQVHFGNAVRLGDHVYATSGDFGPAFLVGLDLRDGEIAWTERDVVGKASMLVVDDSLLMLDEKGRLVLARATPQGVEVLASHDLVDGKIWAPPTMVGRELYVRAEDHLYAFRLGG